MGIYPKSVYVIGRDRSVLQIERAGDKNVKVKPDLPGTVIAVHGVNDVGVGYESVEGGLCEGMMERLNQGMVSGKYRLPKPEDSKRLEPDPDAVFFKRTVDENTHSPVVPFYWGYREVERKVQSGKTQPHGQSLDRHGNRLDLDYSKGGGTFANATSTLPDMWGRGKGDPMRALDRMNGDALRPVLDNPGRMYMILAAKRLAALVSMIRDYDDDETVSIVAHSQGCMLSLLAQAFLQQRGLRSADTLILTHPPYSLVDDLPFFSTQFEKMESGEDAAMRDRYHHLKGGQTLNGRLSTLANIVRQVVAGRHAQPSFGSLKDSDRRGVVGTKWEPSADRDNRGKVYLYFSPEDMTVGLQNVQGLGWQGVPDSTVGSELQKDRRGVMRPVTRTRYPMREIGAGFFQRVFTAKKRPDPQHGKPVLVGGPPADFALRVEDETSFEHAAGMAHFYNGSRVARSKQDKAVEHGSTPGEQREGWRTINGEPLARPVLAEMYGGAIPGNALPAAARDLPVGSIEQVDPIDAAIATTSAYANKGDGVNSPGEESGNRRWFLVDDPTGALRVRSGVAPLSSPHAPTFKGAVIEVVHKINPSQKVLNGDKPKTQQREVKAAYECLDDTLRPNGRLLLECTETPDEQRLRWQQSTAPRSFHSAIFGGRQNHRQVTAFDVAIGQGKAPSDPKFNAYLCAVADWRLKKLSPTDSLRPGILDLNVFLGLFGGFFECEPSWRRDLIMGNCTYYTSGVLPPLPVLPDGLPQGVVCESFNGDFAHSANQQVVERKP